MTHVENSNVRKGAMRVVTKQHKNNEIIEKS